MEKQKLRTSSPLDSVQSYMELFAFNLDLISRSIYGSMKAINNSGKMEVGNAIAAMSRKTKSTVKA
ncbi:hypothetical protein ACFLZE_04680 [Thermodesulfobacteriota bacterium]